MQQMMVSLNVKLSGNQLASASEDGTVCIWDTRKQKPIHTISPHLESSLSRPNLGKWIGAVTMNEDWLVSARRIDVNTGISYHPYVLPLLGLWWRSPLGSLPFKILDNEQSFTRTGHLRH